MNFAIKFIIGRQLALNQQVTPQQATQDGLLSAVLKSPLGLILALALARGQRTNPPASLPGGGQQSTRK